MYNTADLLNIDIFVCVVKPAISFVLCGFKALLVASMLTGAS